MAKQRHRRMFRITHRTAGLWALFSMWLCVLFTISYGQEAVTQSTNMAYMMMAKWPASPTGPDAIFFQFYDEVGLYASNAAILLASLLILAVFKPKYRFAMMAVAATATSAVATGLLEKLVYRKWAGSNDTLLMAESVRESASMVEVGLGTWAFNPAVILNLGSMLVLDFAIILLSAAWALASWRISAGRAAALHVKTAAA
ncbi:hypothetical protein O9X98_10220 [Agrobacterium salinitolerans]|nr:hypothetical protein [Agrobacterium salinitolerans]